MTASSTTIRTNTGERGVPELALYTYENHDAHPDLYIPATEGQVDVQLSRETAQAIVDRLSAWLEVTPPNPRPGQRFIFNGIEYIRLTPVNSCDRTNAIRTSDGLGVHFDYDDPRTEWILQ